MIQRFLYTVLEAGIEEILADLTILDDIFVVHYELTQDEVDAIKTAFQTKTPNVIHGYARAESEFPLYSIVLVSEQESEHFMGDDAGMIDESDDPDFGADRISTIWDHHYNILCYTEHPDLTLYYYEIAKAILMTADLNALDLFQVHVSGMDLMPDERYLPDHLFVRQLAFQASREFERIDKESKLGKAFRVRGIHVDSSGSPSDVGGVKTLVIPVDE